MTNRLAKERSPYLLQHAENPVDWYPWGDEALARAKAEDKPMLLSIGYSACHWCHVMEHESFENAKIAALMNEHFVCVKVDREERPDLDQVYQLGIQLLTRHGGWPLTVFCFPDGRPFYGGTYFPPTDRHGMPGFPTILQAIAQQWRGRRADMEHNARALTEAIREASSVRVGKDAATVDGVHGAARKLAARVDIKHGGFGTKPKFPNATSVSLLLRDYAHTKKSDVLGLVETTLRGMAHGGLYDHLGGGFHRYSVDERWLVPHFEKMLYDNALLARLYVDGWRATKHEEHARVVRETLTYVIREMQSPEGGYYSTQDADSEGHEGKFFAWRPKEIQEVLGTEDADVVMRVWGVTDVGNFEHGASVISVNRAPELVASAIGKDVAWVEEVLGRAKKKLFAVREKRVKPARDEKILAGWNGLMIGAMAEAAVTFGEGAWLDSAKKAATFVQDRMTFGAKIRRSYKDEVSQVEGFLEDVAYQAAAHLDLYEATLDSMWLARAEALAGDIVERYLDAETGTFFFASKDHEALFHRAHDIFDNATPSGSSVAAEAFARLADATGEEKWRGHAEGIVRAFFQAACDNPFGFSQLLAAADRLIRGSTVVALAGDPTDARLRALQQVAYSVLVPNRLVVLVGPDDALGRKAVSGAPAAYVCHGRTCSAPATKPEVLRELLTGQPD